MADPVTANIGLAQPLRGSDVGVWDTPMNNNASLLDSCIGANTVIPLNNSNVTLSAAQFQSKLITFNSTLTGNVVITFPTSFTKSYEIQNLCTGSSAFTITLQTGAGQAIACPPGEAFDCFNDGANIKFKNFGRVGSYWDYYGSAVPAWVSGCTVPPYLYCNGTTFSSATYPALTVVLNGTTLPDFRGRLPAFFNDGTGRLLASFNLDGNTLAAAGGSQSQSLVTANLPPYTPSGTNAFNPGGAIVPYTFNNNMGPVVVQAGSNYVVPAVPSGGSWAPLTGITFTGNAQGGVSQSFSVVPPATIGGIRMIRAG